jgi:hypothetical protein
VALPTVLACFVGRGDTLDAGWDDKISSMHVPAIVTQKQVERLPPGAGSGTSKQDIRLVYRLRFFLFA